MKKLRVALIGIAHTHVMLLYYWFNQHAEYVDWVGYADIPSKRGETIEERRERNFSAYNDVKYYENYKDIIKLKPDIILINTELQDHGWLVSEIMKEDINVLVEKPMAINMEDAKVMYEAAKNSKAELMINWPIAWFPFFHLAKNLVDSGEMGDVLRVHYRSPATWGPYELGKYSEQELKKMWWYNRDSGGGSIVDYACYGCVLATWFFGEKAKSVYGIRKNFLHKFSDIEDYSTFVLNFENGVGLLEGSWSTFNSGEIPTGPIIYGTKGTLVCDRYTDSVKLYKTPSHDFTEPDKVYDTAEDVGDVGINVINHLLKGEPLNELITLEFNMKAMAALDAGTRSCDSKKEEITL